MDLVKISARLSIRKQKHLLFYLALAVPIPLRALHIHIQLHYTGWSKR